jgi:hypothetical protein
MYVVVRRGQGLEDLGGGVTVSCRHGVILALQATDVNPSAKITPACRGGAYLMRPWTCPSLKPRPSHSRSPSTVIPCPSGRCNAGSQAPPNRSLRTSTPSVGSSGQQKKSRPGWGGYNRRWIRFTPARTRSWTGRQRSQTRPAGSLSKLSALLSYWNGRSGSERGRPFLHRNPTKGLAIEAEELLREQECCETKSPRDFDA